MIPDATRPPFRTLFGHAPELGGRGHCAQDVQCAPNRDGCACRREVEAEILAAQRAGGS